MKKQRILKCIALCLASLCLSSCIWRFQDDGPEVDYFYSNYEPQIVNRSEIDSSIELLENQEMVESSKIYVIGNYIFINDKHKGFHIFDNEDPENPIKKNFLNFPGSTDIAIRNNILYVNQATDLVALNFDFDAFTFSVENRVEDVFPELIAPDGYYSSVNSDQIVVNWIEK